MIDRNELKKQRKRREWNKFKRQFFDFRNDGVLGALVCSVIVGAFILMAVVIVHSHQNW